jgi:hypothetical protein
MSLGMEGTFELSSRQRLSQPLMVPALEKVAYL